MTRKSFRAHVITAIERELGPAFINWLLADTEDSDDSDGSDDEDNVMHLILLHDQALK